MDSKENHFGSFMRHISFFSTNSVKYFAIKSRYQSLTSKHVKKMWILQFEMEIKRKNDVRYAVCSPIITPIISPITNKENVEYFKETVSHIYLGLEKGLLTMLDIYNQYKESSEPYLFLAHMKRLQVMLTRKQSLFHAASFYSQRIRLRVVFYASAHLRQVFRYTRH